MGMTCADTNIKNEVIPAENWQDWIIEMVKSIRNTDYLRQIYYFTLVKYDKCKKDC